MAKDLKKIAAECLAFNKLITKIHVTSDGTPFPQKGDAVNHARTLADKEVLVFERDGQKTEVDEDTKQYALNVKDSVKLLLETTTEEALDLLITGEERKTVLAAAAQQRAVIKQAALDEQARRADEANATRKDMAPVDGAGTQGLGDGLTQVDPVIVTKVDPVVQAAPNVATAPVAKAGKATTSAPAKTVSKAASKPASKPATKSTTKSVDPESK